MFMNRVQISLIAVVFFFGWSGTRLSGPRFPGLEER